MFVQIAKLVLGLRGQRAACTAFNSGVSSVPAAVPGIDCRTDSVTINSRVCVNAASMLLLLL